MILAERWTEIKTDWFAEDRRIAYDMLRGGHELELEWLTDVIDGCTHEERKQLRKGLETGPRNLWYDYDEQTWID